MIFFPALLHTLSNCILGFDSYCNNAVFYIYIYIYIHNFKKDFEKILKLYICFYYIFYSYFSSFPFLFFFYLTLFVFSQTLYNLYHIGKREGSIMARVGITAPLNISAIRRQITVIIYRIISLVLLYFIYTYNGANMSICNIWRLL